MGEHDWKTTIRTNIFLLKLVGLWPRKNESYKLNLYTFYTVLSFVAFQATHTGTQIINLFFIYDDLEALTGTIFVLLTKFLAVLKSCFFIKNMKTLKELMVIADSDVFQLKNAHQRNMAASNARFWTRSFMYFWSASFGSLIFWTLYPILSGAYAQYRLPFFAWYPYEVKKWPNYQLTYVYQIFCTGFLMTAGVDMDLLIAALNLYTGTQLDILCDDLLKLRFAEDDESLELRNCIEHHRKILAFADTTGEFINWIILLQFFTGAVSIGFSMFQLTLVTPFSSEFYSFVCYGVAMICEMFIYCWFGNEVAEKSSNIVYSVFESNWVEASTKTQKEIITFMVNAQKPLQVSAFGLFTLTVDAFMKILKTAWSYFALLHNVRS